MRRFWKLFIASGFAAGLCCGASAQTAAAEHGDTTSAAPVATTTAPSSPPATFAAKTLEIPAGTKVLLTIRSAINTKTAQAGDGVYLQSSFPVVANGRTVIPAGVYVQGVVDAVERHIRIKGPAKLTMHFTSIIFPNGTVVEIPGLVNSLPGSDGPKVKGDEGTVQQGSSVGDVAKAAGQGAAIGAGVGGISGGVNGHPVEGLGLGAAAGGVVGAAVSLFTHGNDISIPSGTPIEMVLQRPLILEQSNLGGPDVTGEYLPAANQRQPMAKPGRSPMTCPPGSLGCG
jgi:type IV secretion system protein VirB10